MGLLTVRLQRGDVSVRPLRRDDASEVFRHLSTDEGISKWTRIPWPYTAAHLDGFMAQVEQWHAGSTDIVAAVTVGDDTLIGCCGLHRIGAAGQVGSSFLPCELGYWLAESARGRGVMHAAAGVMVQFALHDLGLARVNVQTKVGNVASQRVLRAIGFEFTETVLGVDLIDDDTDHDRFVMTPDLWREQYGSVSAPERSAL